MGRHVVDPDETSLGLGGATSSAIRRAVGTRARRWLVVSTVLLGLFAAVAVAAGAPADRTFAALSGPVQSLMSVIVPCLGILLAHDLRRAPQAARVAPTVLAATLWAAVIGVCGALACAGVLAVAVSGAAADPWRYAGVIVVGSVLVQVVAQLVGIGLGLLLRSFVVAFAASVVLPMGLWLLLGSVDALRPVQAWLAPYSSVQNLLSGGMTVVAWAQWLAILLVWGVGLNVVGTARLRRSAP
jgi:hypothetical protein